MRVSRLFLALACGVAAHVAAAADLKILSAGAFKPVLVALQPAFEQQTGHQQQHHLAGEAAVGLDVRAVEHGQQPAHTEDDRQHDPHAAADAAAAVPPRLSWTAKMPAKT